MDIGKKIREIRKSKKITLVELSKITGVAQATLSRIETGIMRGTVDCHKKITEALGLGLGDLYGEIDDRQEKTIHLQRDERRGLVSYRSEKVKCELLTQEPTKKKITPLLLTLQPKAELDSEKKERGTEKFLMTLEGEIQVKIDKKEYSLKEGETLYFDASLPHQITNPTSKTARLFCALSPSQI